MLILPTFVLVCYIIYRSEYSYGSNFQSVMSQHGFNPERGNLRGVKIQDLKQLHDKKSSFPSSLPSAQSSSSLSSTSLSPSSSPSSTSSLVSIMSTTTSLSSSILPPGEIRLDDNAHSSTLILANRKFLEEPVSTLPYSTKYKNPCWNENGKFYCLPYFFLAGFPKCGTTDLYAKLKWHPEITSSCGKELHWWTRARFGWARHGTGAFRYRQIFDDAALEVKRNINVTIVDGTPSTIWDNTQNIHNIW